MQDKVDEDNGHLREGQKGRVPDVVPPIFWREMISRGAADRSFDGVKGADVAGVQTFLQVGDGRVLAEVVTGHIDEFFFVGQTHHFRGLGAAGRDGNVDEDVFVLFGTGFEVVIVARVGRGDNDAFDIRVARQIFNAGRPSGAEFTGYLLSAFGDNVIHGYQSQVRIRADGPLVVSGVVAQTDESEVHGCTRG